MSRSEFEDEYDAWVQGDERRIRDEILRDPIRKLGPSVPISVTPSTTVRACIDLLCKHHIGCLLISEGDKLVGIFSERDVVTKVAGPGLDPATTPVADVMTRNPEGLEAGERIAVALNRMMVGGYRHIPVTDEAGKAVGIVSVRNFVRYIVSLFPEAVLNQPSSQTLKHPNRMHGG